MARTNIISGAIVARYDEKCGPTAVAWYPAGLSKNARTAASIKSFSLLSADQDHVPKDLEIVSFPAVGMKGLIRFIPVPDDAKRGGISYLACVLAFPEEEDIIFYKFIHEFEPIFDRATETLSNLEVEHADATSFSEFCTSFHRDASGLLDDLASREKRTQEPGVKMELDSCEEPANTYIACKIVVCGDPEVGKTSLILRFTDNAFNRTYIETMGVCLSTKKVLLDPLAVNLVIWDVAGQAKFKNMHKFFYTGAKARILVFDLTNPTSFTDVLGWNEDFINITGKDVPTVLIGNKSDLLETRCVEASEIEQVVAKHGFQYIETSAMTGENVDLAFQHIAELLAEKIGQ
jgi:small GTP-binding protein